MQIIEATWKEVLKSKVGDAAQEDDASIYIKDDCIITVEGKPVAAYGDLDFDPKRLLAWAKQAEFGLFRRLAYGQGKQFSTKKTYELYFGYTMGRHVYNAPPGPTRTTRDYPQLFNDDLIPLYEKLAKVFETCMPEQYAAQMDAIKCVGEEWRIGKGLYTQMVFNNANVFSYHVDAMNFKDSWNVMAVFANGCVGGNTIIPALDMRFSMRGAKYLIFNAQKVIHGVTPLTKVRADSYRYSLVYYAQAGMSKLGKLEDELDKFRVSLDKRFDAGYQEERAKATQVMRKRMQKSGYK